MLSLDELDIYKLSMEIGDEIWELVIHWDNFAKNSIGNQIVRSADSIAANISEGYGRYYYSDNKKFCYYSRGSLLETKVWLTKAYNRGLIKDEIYNGLIEKLKLIHFKLNAYIKSLKSHPENDKKTK